MIYVTVIIKNIHLIFEIIHLFYRCIYIYDSLRSLDKPNELKTHVTYLTMLLLCILNIVNYYEENGDPKGDMA